MKGDPAAVRGHLLYATILCILCGVALLAPFLPLEDPRAVHLDRALEPPSFSTLWIEAGDAIVPAVSGPLATPLHRLRESVFGRGMIAPVLGTDELGRCLFSRLVFGARVSLAVALVASLIALVLGSLYGIVSGLAGGAVDRWMMRLVDIVTSLPIVFLVIFVVALLRGHRNAHPEGAIDQIWALFLVIGAVSWLPVARLLRAEVLGLSAQPFIEAAVLAGQTRPAIIRAHVLPNVAPILVVALTLNVPRIFLLEAFLSFLGLGVEAPGVSWGSLARQGYDALTAVHATWWMVVFPACAFAVTLLSMNLLGDALRDLGDPRLADQRGIKAP